LRIACETDHIAAWKDSFRGVARWARRNKTFVLSESGHIAGIVNPPSKKKYGHYTNPDLCSDARGLAGGAEFHEGLVVAALGKLAGERSGKQVPARIPGRGGHTPVLAPGARNLCSGKDNRLISLRKVARPSDGFLLQCRKKS
jgi:polyhydroxyalkanoate synthase